MSNGLRAAAEAAWLASQSTSSLDLSAQDLQSLVHELQVHKIELEMQNDELRRTRAALDESRAHYLDLYDLAPVGYCTVGENGHVVQANRTLANLLGIELGELVSKSLSLFVDNTDKDRWYLTTRAVLNSRESRRCELRLLRNDGSTFWVELQVVAAEGSNDEPCLRVVVSDISERKFAQEALETSLEEKVALLREVHHRVKNNLQIISSLLKLESARSKEPAAKDVLSDMNSRIRSMALVHETLYRSDSFSSVDLGKYLRELGRQTFQFFSAHDGLVRLELDLASLPVSMDLAIPCGLLANELIVNSFKHGFADGRAGEVRIELKALPVDVDGKTRGFLRVSDTGMGLGADFESRRGTTLGLQIAKDLSRQIGGTLDIESDRKSGVAFSVTFAFEALKAPKANGGEMTLPV